MTTAFQSGAWQANAFQIDAVSTSTGPGGSGARYRTHTDWDEQRLKKRRQIEAKLEKVEKRIEAQKSKIEDEKQDYGQASMAALSRQLLKLQQMMLDLLAELDLLNKSYEDAEMQDVAVIVEIIRRFH